MSIKEEVTTLLMWLFLVIPILILTIFFFYNSTSEFALPALMIIGVIALFAVLSFVGRTYAKTDLACKEEALGLPSGSIRALIALSLIIIFAIMTIFMYNQLEPTTSLIPLQANQTIILPNGTLLENPNGMWYVNAETSEAQRDFSLQALTTVSTLVVALAGFYFGTKSVAQAQKSKEPPEASLSFDPPSPAKLQLKGKPEDDKLLIKVKTTPEQSAIDFEIKDDKGKGQSGTISRTVKNNEFVFTPPANVTSETTITLKFWMIKYRGDAKELVVKIIPASKPKPSVDEKIKAVDEELTILTQRNDGIKAQMESFNKKKNNVADKLKKETDEQKKKSLEAEQAKIDKEIKSLEPKLKDIEKQIEKKKSEKKELEGSKEKQGEKTESKSTKEEQKKE